MGAMKTPQSPELTYQPVAEIDQVAIDAVFNYLFDKFLEQQEKTS